eukprot:m.137037 g.137037  ORF g.137037 m.137037 type:complete len:602 (-) comp14743_c0_seq4:85-1890(-)
MMHWHINMLLLIFVVSPSVFALDNGLALKPLMGWRNWISMHKDVNQSIMEEVMRQMANNSRFVDGNRTSLIDLGYNHIGLDDAWQACGSGINGSFHDENGYPLINTTRFPSMKNMNALAHSLGLTSNWYMNNCVCQEHQQWSQEYIEAHYKGDVQAIIDFDFDGVKLDSCGQFRNLSYWAKLLNATGKPILIENCHQGMTVPCGEPPLSSTSCGWPDDNPNKMLPPLGPTEEGYCSGTTSVSNCPYHLYRSSGDVQNSWLSVHGNMLTTIKFALGPKARSRPGAWAYPDTAEIGRLSSESLNRLLFGLYCITSSPLILGHAVTNTTLTDEIWPIISNKDAITVHQTVLPEANHPGTRIQTWDVPGVEQSKAFGPNVFADVCDENDSSQIGWSFDNKTGQIKGPRGDNEVEMCLDTTETDQGTLSLNPCDDSAKTQRWTMNSSGYIHRSQSWCLAIHSNIDVFYGVLTQPCYRSWDRFEFTEAGQLRSITATIQQKCIVGRTYAPPPPGESIELWQKPLASNNDSIAILIANLGARANVVISPRHALANPNSSRYYVYDVWKRSEAGIGLGLDENYAMELDTYESAFLIFNSRFATLFPEAS